MPWNPDDADRFKQGLSDQQKSKWASIANSVLQRTGDEGAAIRAASGSMSKPSQFVNAAKRRLQSQITGPGNVT